jgi:uncharacterized protein (DUF697 family)
MDDMREESNGAQAEKKMAAQTGDVFGQVLKLIDKAISSADEKAAAERVAAWRSDHPDASVEALAEALIKAKARQTAAVGAATSSTDVIPGLGTLAALALGAAADIGVTFRLQSELVLEIAAAYGHPLNETEKRDAVLVVTGLSVGANRLLSKAGRELGELAAERFAGRSVLKAVPFLGIAASAGANALTTYVIGRRAVAYFERGPEAMGDWADNLRALTGVDERRVAGWLADTAETTGVAGTARALGQTLGEASGVATGAVAKAAGQLRRTFRRR